MAIKRRMKRKPVKDVLDELAVPKRFREVRALPPKRPMGRPTIYSRELALEICRRLADGDLAIDIVQEEGMPSLGTIFRWRDEKPDFRELYAIAREMQGHASAERAVREGRNATTETAHAARVRFDADRWFAAKLLPKVYADRVDTNVTANVAVTMTPEQRQARLTELEKRRQRRELLGGAV